MAKETLQSKWIRCGKESCRSCPHGPYWYAFWREGNKTRCRYIGKERHEAPPPQPLPPREAPHPDDAILSDRTATLALALRILQLSGAPTEAAVKAAYRRLCLARHPDRGGTQRDMMRLNAAYAYLRSVFRW